MTSKTTKQFREALSKLPTEVQRKAVVAYQRFRDTPDHRSLRFKKVHPREPIYSVRISVKYRAVGIVDGDTIVWFWIGIHSEYEELLKRI